MGNESNTFGDYEFASWIPERIQGLITDFWGIFGRTNKDWLDGFQLDEMQQCNHGPGPNGFGHPPFGATVEYVLRDYNSSEEAKEDRYKLVQGRYIHRWNNLGSLIDENGDDHFVSSCDRWIRVWQHGEAKS